MNNRVFVAFLSGCLVAACGPCPPQPIQPAPASGDFDAERAYMPYYLVALELMKADSELFALALTGAFERTAAGLAERDTREILCVGPEGEVAEDAKTAAQCDKLADHAIQEVGANCVVMTADVAVEAQKKPQRNKPDGELTDKEKELEGEAKRTGIPRKAYVPNTHDCDDYAYRMHKAVRGLGVKWFTYTKPDGRKVGHAVNYVDGPGGRTYLEPQTGEVIVLPEPRHQDFESTDPAEIDRKQQRETDREQGR